MKEMKLIIDGYTGINTLTTESKEIFDAFKAYTDKWSELKHWVGSGQKEENDNDAAQLGKKIDKFVNVKPNDTVVLAVKSVDVYAKLNGVNIGIQLNDLPGADSASKRLNDIASESVKEMDLLLFLVMLYFSYKSIEFISNILQYGTGYIN